MCHFTYKDRKHSLKDGGELLPQTREFQCLRACSRNMKREMDGRFGAASAGIAPDHCGEDGAEPEGKTLDLAADLHSNPHLCS